MHEQAFTILEYDELRALIGRGAQTPVVRMGEARGPERSDVRPGAMPYLIALILA